MNKMKIKNKDWSITSYMQTNAENRCFFNYKYTMWYDNRKYG